MAKVALQRTRAEVTERKPRNIPPRLTVYRDGLAKLTRSAHSQLGNVDTVHILHDSENKNTIYLSQSGGFPHKIGKQGTFSAASLHRHIGSPDHPVHVNLMVDADGDLVGDLSQAIHGENAAPRAKMAGSEGVSAVSGAHQNGTVDPLASSAGTSDPVASGPSDTFDEDDDEEYEDDEDEIDAVIKKPAAAKK